MQVTGVNSNVQPQSMPKTQSTQSSQESAANAMNGAMGKDGFMKLFLASLRYQDPSSPMETKDMMAQMSQLTMVESVSNLSETVNSLKQLVNENPLDKGVNFLGKDVSGINKQGEQVEGEVTEVSSLNGILQLTVGEQTIQIGSVGSVANYDKYASF